MLIKQLIDLEKIRTEHLKFRTELRDQVMDDNTVNDCLQRQIAQKIFKLKIEARPGNAGHYMAFKNRISFATDLAANFGCYRFRITRDIVSKLLCATI